MSLPELKETDVVSIIKEEWENRVRLLSEALDIVVGPSNTSDEQDALTVSDGLKVKHKQSGIRYTIVSVSPRDIVLKTPEGEDFLVDAATLENDYCLS